MDFLTQIEKLRKEAKRRVAAKEITVTELAGKAGFSQSSMSDFLSGKKRPGIEKLNALLFAMDLTTEDLQEPVSAPTDRAGISVPIVDHITAIRRARIPASMILGTTRMRRSVPRQKSDDAFNPRLAWTRFVAIQVDAAQARFMRPLFYEDTTVILDRHDQKLDFSKRGFSTIYAITEGQLLMIGYLRQVGTQLQLHPHLNMSLPIVIITLGPLHQIVGRVCHFGRDI